MFFRILILNVSVIFCRLADSFKNILKIYFFGFDTVKYVISKGRILSKTFFKNGLNIIICYCSACKDSDFWINDSNELKECKDCGTDLFY